MNAAAHVVTELNLAFPPEVIKRYFFDYVAAEIKVSGTPELLAELYLAEQSLNLIEQAKREYTPSDRLNFPGSPDILKQAI